MTRTPHSTVTGARLTVPGARLTVHVVASRSTVHGPAIRVVPGAPCRGCQAQTHPPRYQAYRPRCQACYKYPVCQTHYQRVPGLPSLVLGLPYPVVSDAPSRVPRLAVPGTMFTVHVVASRRTVPGLGYESTIQPAPCPLQAHLCHRYNIYLCLCIVCRQDARARGQDAFLRVTHKIYISSELNRR